MLCIFSRCADAHDSPVTVLLPYIGSCLPINFRFWLTPASASAELLLPTSLGGTGHPGEVCGIFQGAWRIRIRFPWRHSSELSKYWPLLSVYPPFVIGDCSWGKVCHTKVYFLIQFSELLAFANLSGCRNDIYTNT